MIATVNECRTDRKAAKSSSKAKLVNPTDQWCSIQFLHLIILYFIIKYLLRVDPNCLDNNNNNKQDVAFGSDGYV